MSSILTVIFCGSSQWNLNQPPIMLSQSGHEPLPLSRPAVPTYWLVWVTSGTMRVAKLACDTLPAFSVSSWSYIASLTAAMSALVSVRSFAWSFFSFTPQDQRRITDASVPPAPFGPPRPPPPPPPRPAPAPASLAQGL